MQFLSDVFWRRWRQEYLPLLLGRQKWVTERRSHCVGDLVLVVDQLLTRNLWCLGRIISVGSDSEGIVRRADVKVSRCKIGKHLKIGSMILSRPINKLVLLRTADEM